MARRREGWRSAGTAGRARCPASGGRGRSPSTVFRRTPGRVQPSERHSAGIRQSQDDRMVVGLRWVPGLHLRLHHLQAPDRRRVHCVWRCWDSWCSGTGFGSPVFRCCSGCSFCGRPWGISPRSIPTMVSQQLTDLVKIWLIVLVATNALRSPQQIRFFTVFFLGWYLFYPARGCHSQST